MIHPARIYRPDAAQSQARADDPLNPPPAYAGASVGPAPPPPLPRVGTAEELAAELIAAVVRWREAQHRAASPLAPERYAGRHFSDLELRIWQALEHGPLKAAQIASRLNREYDHILKVLLPNLEERGVLDHDRRGYRRGEVWPERATESR